ncbi:hypothetical protein BT63DRAFT_190608 [Microthyrium microscopicum]|uniref:Uncharacterized protein n=1 Tax=Microthyrium microscopicum TaxID=703497 RepID=A0A6A6UIX7_9PEZI|nr:hypothetical protein BT63DRAFT_190608 [Microthyrium microscopicum]
MPEFPTDSIRRDRKESSYSASKYPDRQYSQGLKVPTVTRARSYSTNSRHETAQDFPSYHDERQQSFSASSSRKANLHPDEAFEEARPSIRRSTSSASRREDSRRERGRSDRDTTYVGSSHSLSVPQQSRHRSRSKDERRRH